MKYFLYIAFVLTLCSCNKLDGKIETRDKNKVYLVNTSETKAYRFTLKTTSITDDSIYEYKTQLITLQPGDEMFIGSKSGVSQVEYPKKDSIVFQTHRPKRNWDFSVYEKEAKKKDKDISQEDIEFSYAFEKSIEGRDTVINGKQLMYNYNTVPYPDTLHPYPVKRYKYKYEVTGQVEMKSKTPAAKDGQ